MFRYCVRMLPAHICMNSLKCSQEESFSPEVKLCSWKQPKNLFSCGNFMLNMQNSYSTINSLKFVVYKMSKSQKSKGLRHCRLQACQIKSALLLQRFPQNVFANFFLLPSLISHHALINNNWAISSSKYKQLDVRWWRRQLCWINDIKVREWGRQILASPVVVI